MPSIRAAFETDRVQLRFLPVLLLAVLCSLAPMAMAQSTEEELPDDVDAFNTPTNPEALAQKLLGMSFNALRKKDYPNAEKLLLRARSIEPNNPYVLLNLGVVFYRTNRPKLAREVWTRVSNAPVAASSSVIASNSELVGEAPATVARRNLRLLDSPDTSSTNAR